MSEFVIDGISRDKAEAVVRLTNQDVTLGEFDNPDGIANPQDPARVEWQGDRLAKYPELYHGLYELGRPDHLLGYIKTNTWNYADQAGFDTEFERNAKRVLHKVGLGGILAVQWGIHGLVVDNALAEGEQYTAMGDFLEFAARQAEDRRMRAIRVPVHDNDPLLNVIEHYGYRPIKRGVAAGVAGVETKEQTLFENTL